MLLLLFFHFNDFMTNPVYNYDDSLPRGPSRPPFSKTNVRKPADCSESSCPTNPVGPRWSLISCWCRNTGLLHLLQAAKISVPFSQAKINYDERARVNYERGARGCTFTCVGTFIQRQSEQLHSLYFSSRLVLQTEDQGRIAYFYFGCSELRKIAVFP